MEANIPKQFYAFLFSFSFSFCLFGMATILGSCYKLMDNNLTYQMEHFPNLFNLFVISVVESARRKYS